jgi:hypothetical protein
MAENTNDVGSKHIRQEKPDHVKGNMADFHAGSLLTGSVVICDPLHDWVGILENSEAIGFPTDLGIMHFWSTASRFMIAKQTLTA